MKRIDEEKLMQAIGDVGGDLIERAGKVRPAARAQIAKWLFAAACLALVLLPLSYFSLPMPGNSATTENSAATGSNAAPTVDREEAVPSDETASAEKGEDAIYDAEKKSSRNEAVNRGSVDALPGNNADLATEKLPPFTELIGADVTALRVTHHIGGQSGTVTVRGGALERLRDWANGFADAAEMYDYLPDESPDDVDGGEVYAFYDENETLLFCYCINGPQERYLLVNGIWYVTALDAPPIDGITENIES